MSAPDATAAEPARAGAGATNGYYGQPILKPPVWTWEIPVYFFAGGMAGASAGLAYGAHLRGQDVLARRAWAAAMAGLAVSPGLLISDLGRPERFYKMLRMFKPTSPMSVGSWILSLYGGAASAAAWHAFTGRIPRVAAAARPLAALSGLPLATYTGALLATTSVPVWSEARRILPALFAAGAALSASGAAVALTPTEHAAAARRLALLAAAGELTISEYMHRHLGIHAEVYHSGQPARFRHLSAACVSGGALLLSRHGRRNRLAAAVSGTLLCAGALATRWAVFRGGNASVADPRYVIEPQRARRERREPATP